MAFCITKLYLDVILPKNGWQDTRYILHIAQKIQYNR